MDYDIKVFFPFITKFRWHTKPVSFSPSGEPEKTKRPDYGNRDIEVDPQLIDEPFGAGAFGEGFFGGY